MKNVSVFKAILLLTAAGTAFPLAAQEAEETPVREEAEREAGANQPVTIGLEVSGGFTDTTVSGSLTRATGAVNRHGSTPAYPAAIVLPGAMTSAYGLPKISRPLAKTRRSGSEQPSQRRQIGPSALENVRIPAAIYRTQDRPKLKSP